MRSLDTYTMADSQLNYRFDVRLPYREHSGLLVGRPSYSFYKIWDEIGNRILSVEQDIFWN